MGSAITKGEFAKNKKYSHCNLHNSTALPIRKVRLLHWDRKKLASAAAKRKKLEAIINFCNKAHKMMINWKESKTANDLVMKKNDAALQSVLLQAGNDAASTIRVAKAQASNDHTRRMQWYYDITVIDSWVMQYHQFKAVYIDLLQFYEMDALADQLHLSKKCIEALAGWMDYIKKTFGTTPLCIHKKQLCNMYWTIRESEYPGESQVPISAIVNMLPERMHISETKHDICECSKKKLLNAAQAFSPTALTSS